LAIKNTFVQKAYPCLLGIETSCDDTAIAIYHKGNILANISIIQHIHKKYGGVVPELASRDHEKKLLFTLDEALKKANINLYDIDAIAFTQGPGLMGALMVGTSFAKGLAMALNLPLIAVNHLEAHIAAIFIACPKPKFPFLCLLVSGGHTQIIAVLDFDKHMILGSTKDDAAGEAFDKIGKLFGLPYPAGKHIDDLALKGDATKFNFTSAKMSNLDFSFSGLKTQVRYFIGKMETEDEHFIKNNLADLCASVQYTIVQDLIAKCEFALAHKQYHGIGLVGGVSANTQLRSATANLAVNYGIESYIPSFEFCTDNAAMIAMSGLFKYQKQDFVDLSVKAMARF